MTKRLTSASPEETRRLGRALAAVVEAGAVIALGGDLGAGKTTLVQGFAEGIGAPEPVSSPTFVLMRVYRGRLDVYHFDAYRLDDARQLDDFGAEDYFWGAGVSLVEWAERVREALPPDHLEVRLEQLGEQERGITLEAHGPMHARMLDRLEVA